MTSRTRWIAFLGVSIIIISFAAFMTVQVSAQDQSVNILAERLIQKGLPVKQVTVLSRLPFYAEIVIQSTSVNRDMNPEDVWVAQLARREAAFAYRSGIKLDGYKLTFVNSVDEAIFWEQNHLFPGEPSQNTRPNAEFSLGDQAAENLLRSRLDLHGMSIISLDVASDPKIADYGQTASIELSVSDVTIANQALLPFLASFRPFVDDINLKEKANIVLCHIQVFDQKGNQLLNYVWDVETREETSTQAKEIEAWYPQPEPQNGLEGSTSPSQPYPPPQPSPTRVGYP